MVTTGWSKKPAMQSVRSNRGRRQIIQFVIYIRSNVFLQLRGLAR